MSDARNSPSNVLDVISCHGCLQKPTSQSTSAHCRDVSSHWCVVRSAWLRAQGPWDQSAPCLPLRASGLTFLRTRASGAPGSSQNAGSGAPAEIGRFNVSGTRPRNLCFPQTPQVTSPETVGTPHLACLCQLFLLQSCWVKGNYFSVVVAWLRDNHMNS